MAKAILVTSQKTAAILALVRIFAAVAVTITVVGFTIVVVIIGIKGFMPVQVLSGGPQPIPIAGIIGNVCESPSPTFIDIIVPIAVAMAIVIPTAIDISKPPWPRGLSYAAQNTVVLQPGGVAFTLRLF